MKNTGKCPKCGGEDILFVPSHPFYEDDQFIRVELGRAALRQDGISIHRYICCNCGYVEQWIDGEELKRLPTVSRRLEEKTRKWQEEREIQAYWSQKAAEQKKRQEKEKLLRQQEKKRKNDPWD